MPLSWKKLSRGGLDPKILINDDNMQLLVQKFFFLETSFKGSSIGEKNGFWVLAARKLCRGGKDPDISMKGDQTLLVMPMLFVNTYFFRSWCCNFFNVTTLHFPNQKRQQIPCSKSCTTKKLIRI